MRTLPRSATLVRERVLPAMRASLGGDARVKAMILAAGRGERMRPLTLDRPKPLLEVGGLPLIVHHLHALATAGFRDVVVNLSWLGDADRGRARRRLPLRRATRTTATRARSRSRPAAASSARCRCSGPAPFLVLNGDVWTDYPYAKLRESLRPTDLAHLVLVPQSRRTIRPATSCCAAAASSRSRASGCTFSGVGVYRPGLVRRLPGRHLQAGAAAARRLARRPRERRGPRRRLARHRHAGAARGARSAASGWGALNPAPRCVANG